MARVPWSPERGLAPCQSVWQRAGAAVGLPGAPGPPRAWDPALCSPTLPWNSALGLGVAIRCDMIRANASGPPPWAGGDGLRRWGPRAAGPCPSSAGLELPQQTRPDRGLQGKPKGKSLDTGRARACTHSKQGHWSPENMSCSMTAGLGGSWPDWNPPARHGGWPGEGKAPQLSGLVPLAKGWHNSWGRPRG